MKYLNKVEFLGILLWYCFLLGSCAKKQNESDVNNPVCKQIEYVMNDTLSSKEYASIKGIVRKDGFIPTAEIAVQVAELILKYIYGPESIEEQKPFLVNLENNIWIIEGYWDKDDYNTFGGNVYMELSKEDGTILKVIHTK